MYVEAQIEKRIESVHDFCVAIVDIDGFKKVNDAHGHLTGDEVLKQFAGELRSACRSTDVIGRWGGDEFILLFDSGIEEAEAQTERLRKWVCGNYSVPGKNGTLKLRVDASIGLAAHVPGEEMNEIVGRADAAMYKQKARARTTSCLIDGSPGRWDEKQASSKNDIRCPLLGHFLIWGCPRIDSFIFPHAILEFPFPMREGGREMHGLDPACG